MTRFRALAAGGLFLLAYTFAGCFGDGGSECPPFERIGVAQPVDGGGPICTE
jgi:hypothetical protein